MHHRAPCQEISDKGKATETPVEVESAIPSKRSRSKEPSPYQSEEPSTSKRPMPTPQRGSSQKWPSPLIHRRATPDRDTENVAAQPADIPETGSSFIDSLFSAQPYVSQYTEEGAPAIPEHYLPAHELDIIPAPFQTNISYPPEEIPTSEANVETYQSGIYYRSPMPPDPLSEEMQYQNVKYLSNLILRLNPLAPGELDQFVRRADLTLRHMAEIGIEELELQYWVTLCRSVELVMRQVNSLGIIHSPSLLDDLRAHVRIQQENVELMHGQIEESAKVLDRCCQELAESSEEIDSITKTIQELQQKLDELQTKHKRKLRMAEKAENHHQQCNEAQEDIITALNRATASLRTAEEVAKNEDQILRELCDEFHDLRCKVPRM